MYRGRYKLLKDLPDVSKGQIATWIEKDNAYRMAKREWVPPHMYIWLTANQVENSPEWFGFVDVARSTIKDIIDVMCNENFDDDIKIHKIDKILHRYVENT